MAGHTSDETISPWLKDQGERIGCKRRPWSQQLLEKKVPTVYSTALAFFSSQANQALHFPSIISPETGFQISSYPGCCRGFFEFFTPELDLSMWSDWRRLLWCSCYPYRDIVLLLLSVEFSWSYLVAVSIVILNSRYIWNRADLCLSSVESRQEPGITFWARLAADTGKGPPVLVKWWFHID